MANWEKERKEEREWEWKYMVRLKKKLQRQRSAEETCHLSPDPDYANGTKTCNRSFRRRGSVCWFRAIIQMHLSHYRRSFAQTQRETAALSAIKTSSRRTCTGKKVFLCDFSPSALRNSGAAAKLVFSCWPVFFFRRRAHKAPGCEVEIT